VALLGLFVHMALAARRTALARPAALVIGLALLQVALGIATVVGGLATPVRAVHAVIAYALWAALVWLSVHAGCWSMVARGTTVSARTRVGGAARVS
jgi:heme A synthase